MLSRSQHAARSLLARSTTLRSVTASAVPCTAVAALPRCAAVNAAAAHLAKAPQRSFRSSRACLSSAVDADADAEPVRPALTSFSADEEALAAAVGQFAREVVGPRVRHMDEEGCLDPLLLQQMFNQGVRWVIESNERSICLYMQPDVRRRLGSLRMLGPVSLHLYLYSRVS